MVVRRSLLPQMPEWFQELWVDDIPLTMIMTAQGKNYYFTDVMGLKRKHPLGISQEKRRRTREYKEYTIRNKLFFFAKMKEYLNGSYPPILDEVIAEYELGVMKVEFFHGRVHKAFIHMARSFLSSPKGFIKTIGRRIVPKLGVGPRPMPDTA